MRELRLCVDADRAGDEAVNRIEEQVGSRFEISRVALPKGTDPNGILVAEGPGSLRTFLECHELQAEPPPDSESRLPLTETNETGFTLSFETPEVSYQVTPLPPFTGRLRVSVRAALFSEGRKKRFLDRFDLNSARARTEAVKGMSRSLGLELEMAEAHLLEILETTELWVEAESSPDAMDGEVAPVLTEEQKLEAIAFLKDPDLVGRLQADMEVLGYVGEGKGKLLAYLVGLSRKLENPLSALHSLPERGGEVRAFQFGGQADPAGRCHSLFACFGSRSGLCSQGCFQEEVDHYGRACGR